MIPSLFQMSLDNSMMMEIYPYGGIMAYLRYHYLDGITKQSTMLLDKTRVDYDSNSTDKEPKAAVVSQPTKSDEEIGNALARMGIGTNAKKSDKDRANEIRNELDK